MKIRDENGIIHIVYDELFPRKVSPLDKDSKTLCKDWKTAIDRITTRTKKPFEEFVKMRGNQKDNGTHYLLVFCNYYHDYMTKVLDNDNVDISFAVNGIVKNLYLVPDDGPSFLTTMVVSFPRGAEAVGELLSYLKGNEDHGVVGSHTEAYLFDIRQIGITN